VTRRALAAVLVTLLAVAGCGVSSEDEPHPIEDSPIRRPPTTTTTTTQPTTTQPTTTTTTTAPATAVWGR
jgi:ABC-type glycerol-3-phosphate transport system substrate-binding protein